MQQCIRIWHQDLGGIQKYTVVLFFIFGGVKEEKNSFIALPGKGGSQQGNNALKTVPLQDHFNVHNSVNVIFHVNLIEKKIPIIIHIDTN